MLVILTTHPIQYQVPIWQSMAQLSRVPFEVWYLTSHGTTSSYDVQFEKTFSWDVNTLQGYPHRFLSVNEGAAPNRGFVNLRLKQSIIPLLKEKKVKAMLVNGWQVLAYWQVVWQAHRAGVQIWLRAETNAIKPISAWKEPIRKMMLGSFFKRISNYLYIGQSNKLFYHRYGIYNQRLLPGHYCIDNDRFSQQAQLQLKNRAALRKKWNIPEDAICFLFSGKFISKKRPMDIVNAAVKYGDEKRSVHLLFVGSGELSTDLKAACNVFYDEGKQLTKETSCKPAASFTGFLNQSEIVNGYVVADALILPSNFGETWGLVVNEAMACGLPAIVSDQVGCAEDLVAPIDSRLVFSCGNTDDLASSMKYFVQQTIKEVHFKDLVQARIKNYHLSITVDSISELYSRIT